MTAHQIAPRPYSLEKPVRDKKYLDFVRQQPCLVCYCYGSGERRREAAHTGRNGKGMGIKADDRDAIPLCCRCHRLAPNSYHSFGDESKWAAHHGLDLPAIRKRLRGQYEKRRAA